MQGEFLSVFVFPAILGCLFAPQSRMQRKDRVKENEFNFALGEVLRDAKANWRRMDCVHVERTDIIAGNASLSPDILVLDPRMPPVAIECEFGSRPDGDALGRIGLKVKETGHEIRTALAVSVPDRFRRMNGREIRSALRRRESIAFALHQQTSSSIRRRFPIVGFAWGSVSDLSRLVSAAALPKEYVEAVAEKVAQRVEQTAAILQSKLPEDQTIQIAREIYQRSPFTAFRTTIVLWLNALLTQQRLVRQGVDVPPIDFMGKDSVQPSALAADWSAILRQNWNSIFEPAAAVLRQIGSLHPGATGQVLRHLIREVERIETSQLGLYISIGAELFPKLSEDRKESAAFYTTPSAAELLAALTISFADRADWADADLFRRLRMADLACGTGTLLRAGYARAQDFHEQSGGTPDTLLAFHRAAMEEGLIGTDVSPIASHFAASSLAAIGQGDAYGDTQIGWVKVGGSNALTGSLEYLAAGSIPDLFGGVVGAASGRSASSPSDSSDLQKHSISVPDASLDYVLMNPPYSRTRGGQSAFDIAGLKDRERAACQKRWRELTEGEPVSNQAGMAASFLALARQKVKPGGKIGFVLPLTAAFADAYSRTRQMIQEEFENIIAVTASDGSLSADTGMQEMLLTATRRKDKSRASSPIRCVTLRSVPSRLGEAGEVARAIREAVRKVSSTL